MPRFQYARDAQISADGLISEMFRRAAEEQIPYSEAMRLIMIEAGMHNAPAPWPPSGGEIKHHCHPGCTLHRDLWPDVAEAYQHLDRIGATVVNGRELVGEELLRHQATVSDGDIPPSGIKNRITAKDPSPLATGRKPYSKRVVSTDAPLWNLDDPGSEQ